MKNSEYTIFTDQSSYLVDEERNIPAGDYELNTDLLELFPADWKDLLKKHLESQNHWEKLKTVKCSIKYKVELSVVITNNPSGIRIEAGVKNQYDDQTEIVYQKGLGKFRRSGEFIPIFQYKQINSIVNMSDIPMLKSMNTFILSNAVRPSKLRFLCRFYDISMTLFNDEE